MLQAVSLTTAATRPNVVRTADRLVGIALCTLTLPECSRLARFRAHVQVGKRLMKQQGERVRRTPVL